MSGVAANVELIQLGKIVGVWGVRGWVKLHSYTRNRSDIGNYDQWFLQAQRSVPVEYAVLNCRVQGQGIVAQLQTVNDRDQAYALIGQKILIDKASLTALSNGEYYWQQLIGLAVYSTDQLLFGTVKSILETGANDVLVVEDENGINQVLIPYTKQVVHKIDLQQGSMIVDWDTSYLD